MAWQKAFRWRIMLAMNLPCLSPGKVGAIMLRITTQEDSATATLVLEGKCRGPWVEELEQCWRQLASSIPGRKLRVDLERVGFVDERGKGLLAEMYAAGVELRAKSLMMTSLIEGIAVSSSRTAKHRA
jgi:hypothetical protein